MNEYRISKLRHYKYSVVFSAGIVIKIEKEKDIITSSISDESRAYVEHLISLDNHESPDATSSKSTDDLSDNESTTSTDSSASNSDTIVDSPNSISSTLQLNTSKDSTDNEFSGFDETGSISPISSRMRSRISILMGAAMKGQKFKPLIIPCKK